MGHPSDDPSLMTTPEGLRHPDRLPEKVRAAAVALMLGPLAQNPMRLGKALVGSWPVYVRRVAGTTA